jgi:hypothetical protein
MRGKIKLIKITTIAMLIIASFTACSFGNKSNGKNDNSKNTTQSSSKTEKVKITDDTTKTAQLKKEKAVFDGKVYVQNNRAIATMVIKQNVSDKEAKDLAQKYAEDLKKKYKNMQVNVMAVRDNKNVADVTIK